MLNIGLLQGAQLVYTWGNETELRGAWDVPGSPTSTCTRSDRHLLKLRFSMICVPIGEVSKTKAAHTIAESHRSDIDLAMLHESSHLHDTVLVSQSKAGESNAANTQGNSGENGILCPYRRKHANSIWGHTRRDR